MAFGDAFCVFVAFGDAFCGLGSDKKRHKKKGKMTFAFFCRFVVCGIMYKVDLSNRTKIMTDKNFYFTPA